MRTFLRLRGDQFEEVKREVVREQPLTIYVNGERFLTLLCSPMQLEALVVGYLWMEQVITTVGEIVGLEISEVDGRATVTLTRPVALPTERVLTSGCGGGITFRIDHRLFPKRRSFLTRYTKPSGGRYVSGREVCAADTRCSRRVLRYERTCRGSPSGYGRICWFKAMGAIVVGSLRADSMPASCCVFS